MTLESATYVDDLNAAYPEGGSTRTEADDHLRLIKATVVATFPTISATVSTAHAALNTMVGQSELVKDKFSLLAVWLSSIGNLNSAVSLSISAAKTEITALAAALPLRQVAAASMTTSSSVLTFGTGALGGASKYTVFLNNCAMNGGTNLKFNIGPAGGIVSTGYSGSTIAIRESDSTPAVVTSTTSMFSIGRDSGTTADYFNLKIVLERVSGHTWIGHLWGSRWLDSVNLGEVLLGTSTITLAGELDQVQFSNALGLMTGGAYVWAEDLP